MSTYVNTVKPLAFFTYLAPFLGSEDCDRHGRALLCLEGWELVSELHVAQVQHVQSVAIRLEAIASRLKAIASRLEAIAIRFLLVLGWMPSLLDWRPLLVGWRPSILV